MDDRTAAAVDWLLQADEPAIRLMARRDLRGEQPAIDPVEILAGPKVTALLAGQQSDGGFGVGYYRKWTGAHWRLVSLVELEIPVLEPRAVTATGTVLDALTPSRRRPTMRKGLPLSHASVWGNALGVSSRLGLAADQRVADIAAAIVSWQWPDGGWNCDPKATGYRSSFHESLATMWGLHEYAKATGDASAAAAADRTAELFLQHRLFRSLTTGEVISTRWLAPRYPPYWHYDMLQALLVLSRMGKATDPRAADALAELERQRLPDGRWQPGGSWWTGVGARTYPEVVNWGRTGPNEMITLNALRVLRAAGR